MSESMMERALKESCKIELQAVIDERQKWIKAIEDIKAEIKNDYHITCLEIIDKHTKELL